MLIVVDENIPYVDEYFSPFGSIEKVSGRNVKPEQIKNADALIVRSVTNVNEKLLDKNSSIKFVGTCTIGKDHVDQNLLASKGIGFSSAPGCNKVSVGEYVTAALLKVSSQKNFCLNGKTIGIIGAGNTGSEVAKNASLLGMKVKLYDPFLEKKSNVLNKRIYSTFDEVISSDIISFHVPLTKVSEYPTYHMLNKEVLSSINDKQILINASRGAVWDNNAILERKQKGSKLTLIMDVWENEPNVLIDLIPYTFISTPHIAGYSLEGKANGTSIIANNLKDYFNLSFTLPKVSDLLQQAPITNLTLEPNLQLNDPIIFESVINKLVNLVYDINKDSINFRFNYSDSNSFDYMRKNYPVRREWSSLLVNNGNQIIEKLGFRI